MEQKPEIKQLVIDQAKLAIENMQKIDFLLAGIEAKTENKPDVIRMAFDASRQTTNHYEMPEYKYDDFDDYIERDRPMHD